MGRFADCSSATHFLDLEQHSPSTPSSPGTWPESVLPPPGLEVPEAPLPKAQNLRFGTGSFGHPHLCSRPCVHVAKAYCHFPHRPIPKPDWQLRQSLLARKRPGASRDLPADYHQESGERRPLSRVEGLIKLLRAEVRGAQFEPIPMGTFRPMRMSFMHPGISWPFVSEAAQSVWYLSVF